MAATRPTEVSPVPIPPDLKVPGVSDEELAHALGLVQLLDPDGVLTVPERELPRLAPAQLLEPLNIFRQQELVQHLIRLLRVNIAIDVVLAAEQAE